VSVLRNIEQKIESLVEGVFGRAFKTHVQPVELARKLIKEMDDHRSVSVSKIYVPNEYEIYLSEPDYRFMKEEVDATGVNVIGRGLFDEMDGFGGRHPFDKPQVVVTHSVPEEWVAAHPDAPFTFATNGVADAIEQARAIAGDLNVDVQAGKLTTQCLELGLIDELWLDLVPVLLGGGVRFFDEIKAAPILLDGPDLVVEGSRVTHLRYQVRRS